MPAAHRSMLLVGGLGIFFLIENASPLFSLKYDRWKHAAINIFFTITTVVVNFAMAFILVLTADWLATEQVGIIHWLHLPFWAALVFGLLIMDLIGAWLVHFIEHKVKFLWQMHLIHHTDMHVDTTTANRHHPGESVVRFIFTTAAVLIVGAPMWLIFLYQTLSLILTQFNHANIQMPNWLDNLLVLLICTPNMHRVHHHYRQPYSDTNFGNIFSIWDRIFGTFVVADNKKLVYGLDTHMNTEDSKNIGFLLKVPFTTHRPRLEYDEEETL